MLSPDQSLLLGRLGVTVADYLLPGTWWRTFKKTRFFWDKYDMWYGSRNIYTTCANKIMPQKPLLPSDKYLQCGILDISVTMKEEVVIKHYNFLAKKTCNMSKLKVENGGLIKYLFSR